MFFFYTQEETKRKVETYNFPEQWKSKKLQEKSFYKNRNNHLLTFFPSAKCQQRRLSIKIKIN